MPVQHMLFGYRDGHRLLATSLDLPAAAVSRLLGATDASVGTAVDRVISGVPLPEIDLYGLCVTWAAPEAARPGAVWSHVLLLDRQFLGETEPGRVLSAVRRPSAGQDLAFYRRPLVISDRQSQPANVIDRKLITDIIAAAYRPRASPFVIHDDLASAEQALLLVWASQWPALRAQFSFRTRDIARRSVTGADVVVARKLTGISTRVGSSEYENWIAAIADAAVEPSDSALRHFMWAYGPDDEPSPGAAGFLARLYSSVCEGQTDATRTDIEHRYPRLRSGTRLKFALFAEGATDWWRVSEKRRVLAVAGAQRDAWDVAGLQLRQRAAKVVREGGAQTLAAATSSKPPRRLRDALAGAFIDAADPSQLSWLAERHQPLALAWAKQDPAVLEHVASWRGLTSNSALELLDVAADDPKAIRAAIRAGHGGVVLRRFGLPAVLRLVANINDYDVAQSALDAVPAEDLRRTAATPGELTLIAALNPAAVDEATATALESQRADPSEVWLRAAVALLATTPDSGQALEITFGPLHHAITDDRLPRDLWKSLDGMLPSAADPALRLRRFLIETAHRERWPKRRIQRALRGSGPHAKQLLSELDDDDPLTAAVRAAAKAFGKLAP